MTNLDIQNSRHLLKRFHKKMNFLSGIMAQADFIAFNFEKSWIAVYFISLIRNWKNSLEKVLKKSCSQ